MLPNVGFTELLVILVVALLIFGPGKLPEVGKALGKTVREFKGAVNKMDLDIKQEVDDIKASAKIDELSEITEVADELKKVSKDLEDLSKINPLKK